jgi:hypothetical protein
MLWFTVWTVLVLATLGGAFFLGRDLWRKGKALLAELEHAADLADVFAKRTEELTAAAEAAAQADDRTPDILSDRAPHRARLAALRAEREARREARRLRHERTVLGWRAYTR